MRKFVKEIKKRTIILGFSGGKDSVASWLYLTRELGFERVICLFADTGHEFQETYDYIHLLKESHGLPLQIITPRMEDMRGSLKEHKIRERLNIPDHVDVWSERLTMEKLAILKRRFPSSQVRFCTEMLKHKPSDRWRIENGFDKKNCVIATGVRSEESKPRAMKPEINREAKTGIIIWAPIKKWTATQVFEIHKKYRIPENPLYREGHGRVGCAPCIMSKKGELRQIAKRRPETFDTIEEMEKRVAQKVGKPVMTFFSNNKSPERFSTCRCHATKKPILTAKDVKRWALDDDPYDPSLPFEDEEEDSWGCFSVYGLCDTSVNAGERGTE